MADSELSVGVHLLCYSLMIPTVLYLVAVRLLGRWLPFDRDELLLVYIVLTITLPIVGYGGLRFLIGGLGYVQYLSETDPQWSRFLPGLLKMPVLRDAEAVRAFYKGAREVPWTAWTVPIAFWSAYLLALSGLWICLSGILSRIWVKHERLTFPVTILPMQLMDSKDELTARPLFWFGFAVPAVLQTLLVVHQWVPSVPALQLKAYNISFANVSPPWNAFPPFPVGLYPMAVGLAYFVPSDVSFSCWFLALAMRFVYVIGAALGIEAGGLGTAASRFPYREEQAAGAWIAFCGIVLWTGRHHWRSVAKAISQREQRSVRLFGVGAILCSLVCLFLMVGAGLPLFAAALALGVYIAYVVSGARVRAEAGAQWTFAPLQFTPNRVAASITTTAGWSDQALLASGLFSLIHVDIRAQSMPYLMEGINLAEHARIPWRTVIMLAAVGTFTALALGWAATLAKWYEVGAATAKAEQYPMRKVAIAFDEVQRLASSGMLRDSVGIAAMIFGGALTIFLAALRSLGLHGLHPLGYVLCNTLTMNAFIVPFFVAWLVKVCLLRFGGHRAYRGGVPFFVGVILGDITTQGVWTLIGWILHVPIYQFLT
ncbi:MAG: hypothetical protein QHI38_10400 [Armatimonadota bacterium]|nr:hypothetical protein [Armatimonadota bacterium]